VYFIIDRDSHSRTVAFANTKASRKGYLSFKTVILYCLLEQMHYLLGAL
jgi:hypothetical protein